MLDEERHIGRDADAGLQRLIEDVEIARAHRAHLQPEVCRL
ncbi:hypothetical protein ABZW44_43240 [Streptomyces mirabilis]